MICDGAMSETTSETMAPARAGRALDLLGALSAFVLGLLALLALFAPEATVRLAWLVTAHGVPVALPVLLVMICLTLRRLHRLLS